MNKIKAATAWILVMSLLFVSPTFAQVINDTVTLGTGAVNQVYYSFPNDEVKTSDATNWHIAFSTYSTQSSHIRINGGQGVELYALPGDQTAFNTITDTTGLVDTLVQLYDSDTSWLYSAFEENRTGDPFNYGWGDYNFTTHIVTGSRAFLLITPDTAYKKIVINRLELGVWHFTYADIDGSNEVTDSVKMADYSTKNFVGYSLTTGSAVDFEPAADSWDLFFGRFWAVDYNNNGFGQRVTGILNNQGLASIDVDGTAPLDVDPCGYQNSLATGNISDIGYDWKSFKMDFSGYDVDSTRSYFVESQNGEVYQMWLTGTTFNSQGGFFYFSFKQVDFTSCAAVGIDDKEEVIARYTVYPNPSNGNFRLLYQVEKPVNNAVFEVHNLAGQLVYSQQMPETPGFSTIDLNINGIDLPNGIYQTTLRTNEVLAQDKLVIQK